MQWLLQHKWRILKSSTYSNGFKRNGFKRKERKKNLRNPTTNSTNAQATLYNVTALKQIPSFWRMCLWVGNGHIKHTPSGTVRLGTKTDGRGTTLIIIWHTFQVSSCQWVTISGVGVKMALWAKYEKGIRRRKKAGHRVQTSIKQMIRCATI